MLSRFAAVSVLPLLVAACGGADNVYAPVEEVARFAYRAPGPATMTLMTVINNRSGEGGHSALMINGSQRVIFDPAGSWWNPSSPERGDVKYGITDGILTNYIDYHARPSFRLIVQEVEVPPEIAERAIALVEAHGPAEKATCGRSVSGILHQLGFSDVRRSWFPKRIMEDFGDLPRVTQTIIRDDTEDNYWEDPSVGVNIDLYNAPA
ncbi:MAG: hypothetical protein AAF366_02010 [Pseudomonadota bacterium]